MRIALILIIINMLLIGCGKTFDDGPSISFRGAETRIIGDNYITVYQIEGIDRMSLFTDSLDMLGAKNSFRFIEERGSTDKHGLLVDQNSFEDYRFSDGYWNWDGDEFLYLSITFESSDTLSLEKSLLKGKWHIKRLCNTEMWIDMDGPLGRVHIEMKEI